MSVQTSVLESSIRGSLDRSLEDLHAILGLDSGSVLEVGDFKVVNDVVAFLQDERHHKVMTNIWVDFHGESSGRLAVAQTGESVGRLLEELEEHNVGFESAEAAWSDILGEIGNVILNGVIKGLVRDFSLKLEAVIPVVRDTSLFQICCEGRDLVPNAEVLVVDAHLSIDAIGFEADVWGILDLALFAG